LWRPTSRAYFSRCPLEIDGKKVAAELFRHTNKALTITGYQLNTIKQLTNINRVFDWAVVWGERHKAAAAEQRAASNDGNGFNGNGSKYGINEIEQIVREGAPAGADRSGVFHAVIGHYVGCGWDAERIVEHLDQHPNGIGDRYHAEGRLREEVERSAGKFAKDELPQFEAKAPPEQPKPLPENDPDLDDELDDDDLDEQGPKQNSNLPPLRRLGDHVSTSNRWLVKKLLSTTGVCVLAGRRSVGKTFVAMEFARSCMTSEPFLDRMIKRQGGVLWFAAEGQAEVEPRLRALLREKCGGMTEQQLPFRWITDVPRLMHTGGPEKILAHAQQAHAEFMHEHGLPLAVIVFDTTTSCSGLLRRNDDNDAAVGTAIMNILGDLTQKMHCAILAIAHLSETGIRGSKVKEDLADAIWVCLGGRQFGEAATTTTNTHLVIEKNRAGSEGAVYPYSLRLVEEPEPDEEGDKVTSRVVDWLPPGSAEAPLPPDDPWLKGCRQEEQRAGMSRLKRVLLTALADHGVERPIPSATHVRNSDTPIGDELRTPVADAPIVRMVDQQVVWEAFSLCTPNDPRQTTHSRYTRARDRAEQLGLICAGNVGDVTYLWLTRPETEQDEAQP
jgi:AAA domain